MTLNYSTFFGTDKPDADRRWRHYHNLYGIFQFTPLISLTAGFDYGREQERRGSDDYFNWYTPAAVLRITPGEKWAVAARGEYFSDEDGVIINSSTPNGFKTTGLSANVDYLPIRNAALRLEVRNLTSKDALFRSGTNARQANTALTFSTAVSF